MYVIYAYFEGRNYAFGDSILQLQNRPEVGKNIIIGRKGTSVTARYCIVMIWRLQNSAGSYFGVW